MAKSDPKVSVFCTKSCVFEQWISKIDPNSVELSPLFICLETPTKNWSIYINCYFNTKWNTSRYRDFTKRYIFWQKSWFFELISPKYACWANGSFVIQRVLSCFSTGDIDFHTNNPIKFDLKSWVVQLQIACKINIFKNLFFLQKLQKKCVS